MYTVSFDALQRSFARRRATATGFAVSGGGAGTMTLSYLNRLLVDHHDWTWAMWVQGLIVLLLGTLSSIVLRPPRDNQNQ
jgi:MFS family permease